jgi:adenine-specific DNA-methyltransferase
MAFDRNKIPNSKLTVETLTHDEATRKNIPTAEYQSVMRKEELSPLRIAYERRNRDLDPQLVWRGKDEQDWSDLIVQAPPLYIQEKVHPKVLIDDLLRQSQAQRQSGAHAQLDLFADFNGLLSENARTEFYQHDGNWSNRMILGDSLQVMASLAEREGLRGKVQCIYIDPPYGIKFNSNFQWSTTSRDVKDGNKEHITREPEQVKAFRDTWRDGIHSYLTYLRDRLTVARDLLTESGSIFVQIGDENVHRVRALMEEIFGDRNFVSMITIKKTAVQTDLAISSVSDYLVWFCKNRESIKYRAYYLSKQIGDSGSEQYRWIKRDGAIFDRVQSQEGHTINELCRPDNLTSSHEYSRGKETIHYHGARYLPGSRYWSTSPESIIRLGKADRLHAGGKTLSYVRYLSDFSVMPLLNVWTDTGTGGYGDDRYYVVQTTTKVLQRCILMATDPGDLILDPTCGSGTSAYVAEQWGRRWITIDTSRVALALARARIMGARYAYYLLADSQEGHMKKAEISRTAPSEVPTHGNIRHGFVYGRVPHITLKSIANNTEIDVIWEKFQKTLEPLRSKLNDALKQKWEDWQIPREPDAKWTASAKKLHEQWWHQRIARQKEIDASIAARAEVEYLYDKPYEDKKKVRVAGPFTVESLSPHRVLGVDENDELIDGAAQSKSGHFEGWDFTHMILENLKTSGVQQAHKEDKITFDAITPWPGELICAEGRYREGESATEKRAAIFIGPEFGTVSRVDLVAAAREAGDAGFDALIACAFNYDAHSSEFSKLGRIPILKARMNADLHMADDLKNTGKGNLFVIFGEPDIEILDTGENQIQIKINGVDVFHPNTGQVRSDGPEGIACWFIDTDYNEESFFVRHAYFLGANDPYKSLKTTLKAEIDADAWATLNSDTSRPFSKPKSGRIAVKVINHLGDEVMKVFKAR